MSERHIRTILLHARAGAYTFNEGVRLFRGAVQCGDNAAVATTTVRLRRITPFHLLVELSRPLWRETTFVVFNGASGVHEWAIKPICSGH